MKSYDEYDTYNYMVHPAKLRNWFLKQELLQSLESLFIIKSSKRLDIALIKVLSQDLIFEDKVMAHITKSKNTKQTEVDKNSKFYTIPVVPLLYNMTIKSIVSF